MRTFTPSIPATAQRYIAGAVLSACLALSVSACGFDTGDGSESEGEPETQGITLYSGRIAAAMGGAVDAYESEADRDVEVRFAETADLAATLIEEGSSSPADVFFAQEPGAMPALAEEGMLEPLPGSILELVPPAYRDPEGRWVGITGRARVIAYSEDVDPGELPDSPLELADERWRGRVGWGPATSTMQDYVTALRATIGEERTREWLEQMVANDARDYANNVAIRDAIANGEIDVGLINHYYVAQAVAEEGPGYPVRVDFPPDDLGSLLLLTSAGVLRSSERKQEAFDFIRSLLSKPTQQFFTSSSKEYPLAKGVKADPALELSLAEIPNPPRELIELGERQATIELMQEAGAL